MKLLLHVTLAFTSVLALTPQETRDQFHNTSVKCYADHKSTIDEEALRNWYENLEDEPPANVGKLAFCISKDLRWQNEDGEISKENLKETLSRIYAKDYVNDILEECSAKQANKIDTAQHILKCFLKHTKESSKQIY